MTYFVILYLIPGCMSIQKDELNANIYNKIAIWKCKVNRPELTITL